MASKKAKGNDDRISSLPEGVLIHILSFLPTIYSVRTSILSTRWKHLFTFVPNLDFHYSTNTSVQDFINFVNYVFVLYNSPRLNDFCLHFHSSAQLPNFPCPIILWISAAILRNVSKIKISFDFGGRRTLPFDLFSCKTLTVLEIKGNFYVAIPRSAWLPNLKTCSFTGVSFSEESALDLFQNCPKLETLEIITCHMGQGVEVLDISVPKLKRLIMHETVDNYQIRLDAPNLLYFKYMGPASISISKIDSLNSSRDDACVWYRSGFYTRNRIIRDLVQEDYNVRQLHLSHDTMEAFVLSSKLFPIFKNLTRLSLGSISSISSELVLYLLDKSPQLTYLSFSQGSVDDNNEAAHGYVLQEGVPKCVSNHIKVIRFCSFSMFEYDFKIVEYFLKNASVLDKLTIQSSLSCELQLAIVKKVTALPRCSTACKVIFE